MGSDGDVPVAAVVVVGLLVLAGCSSFETGESTPERVETVTPVPVDVSTPSATPTPAGEWVVPGIDGMRVTDVDTLLASHQHVLANRSYTLTWSRRAVGGTDPVANTFEREIAVENATTYRRLSVGTSYPGVVRTYVDPTGVYRRVDVANGSSSVVELEGGVETPRQRFAILAVPVADMLVRPNATDVALVDRDGTRYARLVTREVPPYFAGVYDDYRVENFTGTVWVHPDGYFRSVQYDLTLARGDERIDVGVRYDYTAVGETTVEEPGWVDLAKAGGTPENATGTADAPAATPNASTTPNPPTATPDAPTSTPATPTPASNASTGSPAPPATATETDGG